MKPEDIVRLPVCGMKGEGLTAVWGITLQRKSGKQAKKSAEVCIWDAVELAMAPGEINVVVNMEGYGKQADPQ
jgi:hypothetical protein